MSVFQDHVLPNAKEDLEKSELFTNENSVDSKEKEFVNTVANKSSKELTSKELDKLKVIARKSISASIRVKIWLLLSGGADITYQSLYEETCEELFTEEDFIPDGEEANKHAYLTYYLTPGGGKKLRRLLCILKHLNPDITYCPLLEPIVSILLHFMNEEDTFACASGLLSGEFVSPFLDQTKIENITTDATLQDLYRWYHKKAFNRVSSFLVFKPSDGIEKEVLFPSWRMSVFENLDFVSLIRIFDCLLVEGVKILYRVGLYVLEAFYQYSLTFEKIHCHIPHDLVATIGQYTVSLKVQTEELLKFAMKINITTKQIQKAKLENNKLYKANKLEWIENIETKQVVAVDLRQVSDIIKPNQWQALSEWFPSRIQIKQPQLMFSTNKDGYNLKTLYLMCEEEEQTLMIIETASNEIFGAFMSTSLTQRHGGKTNMSYFGTGETFLFKLSPNSTAYHWNKQETSVQKPRKKMSTYVFVDTKPLLLDESDTSSKTKTVKKTRKVSMKQTFSRKLSFAAKPSKPGFNRSVSRSAYTKRDKLSVSLHPLSAINHLRSNSSVPKHLYLSNTESQPKQTSKPIADIKPQKRKPLMSAQTFDLGDMQSLHKAANFEIVDDEDGLKEPKKRSQSESGRDTKPKLQKAKNVEEFETIEEEGAPPTIGSPSIQITKDQGDLGVSKRLELFISCDNNRFIVGGGESGSGLWIDGELSKGRSVKCETFGNSPLTDGDNGDFTILRVDVFGFQ